MAIREVRHNNVDIRAVIAGVVSGVCMLFIEMTLFVIRSHEMDAAVTKKARKSQTRIPLDMTRIRPKGLSRVRSSV